MNDRKSNDLRIRGVLGRLEAVLDVENARIGHDTDFNIVQSNVLKSRCLYDMTMLFRDIDLQGVDPDHGRHLAKVKEKLVVNSLKVTAHMEAVRNVTELLKVAATAAEADGTYSADQFQIQGLGPGPGQSQEQGQGPDQGQGQGPA